jgi:hypothetical protein
MNHEQIVQQSKSAYKQWAPQWRLHAEQHKTFDMKPFEDFRNSGIGKAVLLVANGYSFEENLDVIKKNQKNVDIFACDKTLGHLLTNGITPKYCIVCDANVSYEKYLKPYEGMLQNTILFQNVCGNPLWTKNGNWKDRYFYINKDVLGSEKEFSQISGCQNFVTAGTNVSNMMVVLLSQSDNDRKQNLFAYDKMLLIGFDYSWKDGGKYYAFDDDGGGKKYYMRHVYGLSSSGKMLYTSNNLNSSASWLNLYVQAYKPNVIQCSPDSLYSFGLTGNLDDQMKYSYKPGDSSLVRSLVNERRSIEEKLFKIDNRLKNIAKDHWIQSQTV